jgi:poly-beta-hydroxyalkanoate depolymerase
MLYQIYETQRALMSPFSEFASASAKLYAHPLSPFAHRPLAERMFLLALTCCTAWPRNTKNRPSTSHPPRWAGWKWPCRSKWR